MFENRYLLSCPNSVRSYDQTSYSSAEDEMIDTSLSCLEYFSLMPKKTFASRLVSDEKVRGRGIFLGFFFFTFLQFLCIHIPVTLNSY